MRRFLFLTRGGGMLVLAGLALLARGTEANRNAQTTSSIAGASSAPSSNGRTVTAATNDAGQRCRGGVDRSYVLYNSLNEAAAESQLVIVGTVTAADSDVRFPSDPSPAGYTAYAIDVEEVLSGDPAGRDQVKAVIGTHSSGCLLPEEQAGPYPDLGDRGVWMLNPAEVQGDYRHLYMLSNVQALINQPAGETTGSGDELEIFTETGTEPITDEVHELGTLDNVIERLQKGT